MTLVTGVNFRQSFDDTPLRLGNPNVLVSNKFVMYPNPANESVYVAAQENVTSVWVVPANPEKIHQDVNFGSVLNTNLYSEESINSHSDFSLDGQSTDNINVNLSTLEPGYYKVFVKIGGTIYWDNLYKNDSQGSTEGSINALINFWELP